MVTWPVSGRAMTGQSPCDPEYRDTFNYGKNYTARLKGRDNCFNGNKSWTAIHWPKAHVWPCLRGASMWGCKITDSEVATSEKNFLGIQELVSDPQVPGLWSFQMLLPISEIPQGVAIYNPPSFNSWTCTLSLYIISIQSRTPKNTLKASFLFVLFHDKPGIWGVLSPLFRLCSYSPFPFKSKTTFFLVCSLAVFFLISQAFGSANSQAWGLNYHPMGAH